MEAAVCLSGEKNSSSALCTVSARRIRAFAPPTSTLGADANGAKNKVH